MALKTTDLFLKKYPKKAAAAVNINTPAIIPITDSALNPPGSVIPEKIVNNDHGITKIKKQIAAALKFVLCIIIKLYIYVSCYTN